MGRFLSRTVGDLAFTPTERRLTLGFAVVLVTVYGLAIAVGWLRTGNPSIARDVTAPLLFPVFFFYVPPLLGVYNEWRGGSVCGSLLLGAVPGLTFPILAGLAMVVRTGPADSPAWVITLAFLVIGMVTAAAGFIGVRVFEWVLGRRDTVI